MRVAGRASRRAPTVPPGGFPNLGSQLWARYKASMEGAHSDGDPWVPQDQSGNGRHMTQATGSKKALIKDARINGKATFLHDGVDDLYDLPDMSALTALTAFVVVRLAADPPPLDAKTGLWKLGTHIGPGAAHYPYTDGTIYDGAGSAGRTVVGNPTPALTTARHYCARSAVGSWEAWLDGASLASNANAAGPGLPTDPRMGSFGGADVLLDGEWAELILCSAALSAGDRQAVEDYVREEYGTA